MYRCDNDGEAEAYLSSNEEFNPQTYPKKKKIIDLQWPYCWRALKHMRSEHKHKYIYSHKQTQKSR